MKNHTHILLTNDDGIHAQGIRALANALIAAGHRVSVCAPDRERSAASHSVTLGRPLKALPADFTGAKHAWSVDGTPSDCASLGLWLTQNDPVDLVISGINHGMNMGGACAYSGTVAAALEAAMCGTQAMAVSLFIKDYNAPVDFAAAARVATRVAAWAIEHPLPLGCIYSVNVPPVSYEELRGLRAARLAPCFMGKPCYVADGEHSYRFSHNESPALDDPEFDFELANQGYAVITKLSWDSRMNEDDSELDLIGL